MRGIFTRRYLFTVVLLLVLGCFWYCQKSNQKEGLTSNFHIKGTTMGVIEYNVKYIDHKKENLKPGIDSVLNALNASLSTYIDDSEITRFNNNTLLKFESDLFYPVLSVSKEVFKVTEGAFDPTVMPIANAWGFGPDKNMAPDSALIDSLMLGVGFQNIFFDSVAICKLEQTVQLDFSAIAKGYAVDLVIDYIKSKGIEDVFVEIGGEVAAMGSNAAEEKAWVVGVENPTKPVENREVFAAFELKNKSLATSGNYRNFRIIDGKKLGHTLNPKTGYPIAHELLSASVFSKSCMEADAYATGFMVLGKDKAIEIIEGNKDLEAFLIYSDAQGSLLSYISPGLKAFQKK